MAAGQLPGRLKHVSVSDGKLYGVNRDDDIYYSPNTQGQWTHIQASSSRWTLTETPFAV